MGEYYSSEQMKALDGLRGIGACVIVPSFSIMVILRTKMLHYIH